ncbi:MAG: hypothetical protein ACJA0S_000790 [Rickettsiales bacterium]|jgi:hypothetical protein
MKKIIIPLFTSCFLFQNHASAQGSPDGIWQRMDSSYFENVKNDNLINGVLDNRIYYEDNFDSDNRKNQHRDAHLNSRLNVNLKISKNFSLSTIAEFDQSKQQSEDNRRNQLITGGGDQSFENEGLFVDELVLNYNHKNLSFMAGKFTANFGDAWIYDNAIWVNQIAQRYRQDEKLGLGFAGRAGNRKTFGEYVFGFSAFTNDRKNLDNSTITKRDGTPKKDGEVGDTRSLKSYVLSTDIHYDFGNDEKLSYHFSYLNLDINERQNQSNIPSKINDQKAYAVNMKYDYPLGKNFLLKSFVEYVAIDNLGGNVEKDSKTLTINFTAQIYKDFFMTLARAKEKELEVNNSGLGRSINEISFGYDFDNLNQLLEGLSLSIGYKENKIDSRISSVTDKSFGFLVRHKIEF